jgi:type III secretory pathway component EscV
VLKLQHHLDNTGKRKADSSGIILPTVKIQRQNDKQQSLQSIIYDVDSVDVESNVCQTNSCKVLCTQQNINQAHVLHGVFGKTMEAIHYSKSDDSFKPPNTAKPDLLLRFPHISSDPSIIRSI